MTFDEKNWFAVVLNYEKILNQCALVEGRVPEIPVGAQNQPKNSTLHFGKIIKYCKFFGKNDEKALFDLPSTHRSATIVHYSVVLHKALKFSIVQING